MKRMKLVTREGRGSRPVLRQCNYWMMALLLVATVGCGDEEEGPVDPGTATFSYRASVNQVHVWNTTPGITLVLEDAAGKEVARGTSDTLGSHIFRKVTEGGGYIVTDPATGEYTRVLTVMSVANSQPAQTFYSSQKLVAGFQYIKMRDGTTLSAFVTLPGPIDKGPYPTTVAYTGYSASKPGAPLKDFTALCGSYPSVCNPPEDPSSLLASVLGFATVSVNIRGTGCSGGAYDYFEPLQILDGYDIIETVAAQPWVKFNKVGMTGVSFGGNSQLFVAQMNPPSLAAISPASVIGDSATTIFPGGMLNEGFALEWINMVLKRAVPYGQGWEKKMVDAGDTVCEENQLLHSQLVDNVAQARATKYYDPKEHDQYNIPRFANKIKVPIFLTGGWQDEQTGPFFTEQLDQFTASPSVRIMTYNGVHNDCYQPLVLSEWKAFLDLFVARRVPIMESGLQSISPLLFQYIYDTAVAVPDLKRFASVKTHAEALTMWKAEPMMRNFFDSGGAPSDVGSVGGQFSRTYTAWPPTGAKVLRYYLQPDGKLGLTAPTTASSASSFQHDPDAGKRINLKSGDVNSKLPKWDWAALATGKAAVFETPALTSDHVLLGNGSADLWVKSTAAEADLQVTISEVRPDGKEMYVQSGWLKASRRKLDPALSNELWPRPTYSKADAQPLTSGQWVKARVAFGGFGHAFRKGSKIRFAVDTPGGTRARWRFELDKVATGTIHTIGHEASHPSSVALSLILGDKADTPLPACPSLRGQPCRTHVAYSNTLAK